MKLINDIPISQIIAGKNDRTIFDERGLRELADSIKEHGLCWVSLWRTDLAVLDITYVLVYAKD
jgi:ParB-like chromosome segregation protein Spo0J